MSGVWPWSAGGRPRRSRRRGWRDRRLPAPPGRPRARARAEGRCCPPQDACGRIGRTPTMRGAEDRIPMHCAGHQVGEPRRVADEDQVGLPALVLRQRVDDRRPVELDLGDVAALLGNRRRSTSRSSVRAATSKAPLTTCAPSSARPLDRVPRLRAAVGPVHHAHEYGAGATSRNSTVDRRERARRPRRRRCCAPR